MVCLYRHVCSFDFLGYLMTLINLNSQRLRFSVICSMVMIHSWRMSLILPTLILPITRYKYESNLIVTKDCSFSIQKFIACM